MICYFFAKTPSKQSIHQKLAGDYIEKLAGVENFNRLPSAGKNALYIHGGNLLFGKQLNTRKKGKSIDFEWEFVGKKAKKNVMLVTNTQKKAVERRIINLRI